MSSTHQETGSVQPEVLKNSYQNLKQEQPNIKAVAAAGLLGVTEGVLLASRVGEGVTRLSDNPLEILKSLNTLGSVMALTRNAHCFHKRHGVYDNFSHFKHGARQIGLYINPDIDLRVFLNHWAFSFAVSEQIRNGLYHSFQFFNKQGIAVHKVYITERSNLDAYHECVKKFRHKDQSNQILTEVFSPRKPLKPDADIDWSGFRKGWENLKDTHDLSPLMRRFKVGRVQAFKNIGTDLAYLVGNSSVQQVLETVRDKKCEIMVFVGNSGCLQIHTGFIENLKETGGWYNVLDPDFSLHLKLDSIDSVWVTKKPTKGGIETTLEGFDVDGEIIITLFGKHKLGTSELESWREIIAKIPVAGSVA